VLNIRRKQEIKEGGFEKKQMRTKVQLKTEGEPNGDAREGSSDLTLEDTRQHGGPVIRALVRNSQVKVPIKKGVWVQQKSRTREGENQWVADETHEGRRRWRKPEPRPQHCCGTIKAVLRFKTKTSKKKTNY